MFPKLLGQDEITDGTAMESAAVWKTSVYDVSPRRAAMLLVLMQVTTTFWIVHA